MINEVYGRSMTRVAIALLSQILFAILIAMTNFLTLDSVIFVSIAFFTAGIPLLPLIAGQMVSKGIIGVLDTPWFVRYKRYLGATGAGKAGGGR
ncbi:hypothetical protein [Methanoculleus oceani]|uniref:hypothetical protein n=1 Tax=Methanoculleus oceani TaxID=2184756 RepID=UPI0020340AF1|nr:hypothetical protein [Methanoculleus sp. CWC-02]